MSTLLVTLVLFDGGLHLFLAPGHWAAWPGLGVAFLACGALQCGLASLLIDGRSLRGPIAAISALALVVYGLAITTGLPLAPAAHALPEPVTPLGLLSKLAELATLALTVAVPRGRLASSAFA
jgi:hypothetical protein